jgi:hypothetical protein
MSVEFGRLDQAGDRSGALAGQQGSGKEPVFSTCGPDLPGFSEPIITVRRLGWGLNDIPA